MWGIKKAALSVIGFNVTVAFKKYLLSKNGFLSDTEFLEEKIWPRVQQVTMAHDSYYCDETLKPHLASKVHWGFPTMRYGKLVACAAANETGSPLLTTAENVQEAPLQCRRNPDWLYG